MEENPPHETMKPTLTSGLKKVLILSGWAVVMAVVLFIIVGGLYLQVTNPLVPLPESLKGWVDLSLGFLMGTLASALTKIFTE